MNVRQQIRKNNGKSIFSANDVLNCLNEPICAIDYRQSKIVYANRSFANLVGSTVQECYRNGFTDFISLIEPNDLYILQSKVLQQFLTHCRRASEKQCRLCVSINYRIKNHSKSYVNILQRTTISDWNHHIPAVCTNIFTDISRHNKYGNKIIFTVEKCDGIKEQWKTVATEEFCRSAPWLTNREKAVMKLMASGKSLNEISRVLEISYHTVRAHCRNMLVKANCRSQEEFKELASREGWV